MLVDTLYKDESFLPDKNSIGLKAYDESTEIHGIQWIRASKLHKNPVLFDNIEPNDVAQGKIANCWLMAAVSAVTEFSEFVRNGLFTSHPSTCISPDCKYTINLYDFKDKKIIPITVDDYIPVDEHDWLYNPQPLFAQSKGNEI